MIRQIAFRIDVPVVPLVEETVEEDHKQLVLHRHRAPLICFSIVFSDDLFIAARHKRLLRKRNRFFEALNRLFTVVSNNGGKGIGFRVVHYEGAYAVNRIY